MWSEISPDEFLKVLQSNKCEDINEEFGYFDDSVILTFKDKIRVKIMSTSIKGFSALEITQEILNRGDSIR